MTRKAVLGMRMILVLLCVIPALTGCGAADARPATEPGELPETEPSEMAQVPERQTYWTRTADGVEIFLQEGEDAELPELMLRLTGEEEAFLLASLSRDCAELEPECVMLRTFEDIMGYEGFALRLRWITAYYAIEGGVVFPVADTFNFQEDDWVLDVDSDGVTELVGNLTYLGDGYQTVAIFRREKDGIQRGEMILPDLPNHLNWGINSTGAWFDPEKRVFHIRYDMESGGEGTLETAGLEWFAFEPYIFDGL